MSPPHLSTDLQTFVDAILSNISLPTLVSSPPPSQSLSSSFQSLSLTDGFLPYEVWEIICMELLPSELCRLSQVNRSLYRMVSSLPIWYNIYSGQYEACQTRVDSETGLVESRLAWFLTRVHGYPSNSGLSLYQGNSNLLPKVCQISHQICEECLLFTDKLEATGEDAAKMPLVVLYSSLTMPTDITNNPPQGKASAAMRLRKGGVWVRGPAPRLARLCLACRIEHFKRHPEMMGSGVLKRYLSKRDLMAKYHLSEGAIRLIQDRKTSPNMVLYRESLALKMAREFHGGDVGIMAICNSKA